MSAGTIAVRFMLIVIATLAAHGCGESGKPESGADIKRIISLSPSITGQIIDLEAEDMIVGVTTWHPMLKKKIPIIGTYINPSIEKIIALKPDIIFISDEEGEVQRDDFIRRFSLRYHRFGKNRDFGSISKNYIDLAGMLGRKELAVRKIEQYSERLGRLKKSGTGVRVAFLVSVKPIVTVSGGTFISGIIKETGAENVYSELGSPYPLLTVESLVIKNPDAVIVMFRGDDIFLYEQLKRFKSVEFIRRKNIFIADENIIPYYSPENYVKSVENISALLDQIDND